jgi:hypothetical protein
MNQKSKIKSWRQVSLLFWVVGLVACAILWFALAWSLISVETASAFTGRNFPWQGWAHFAQEISAFSSGAIWHVGLLALLILPIVRNGALMIEARKGGRRNVLWLSALGTALLLTIYAMVL